MEKPVYKYLRTLFRVVVTALLLGGVVVLFKVFEGKGALTRNEKYIYNTLFTLLTILLGINIPVSCGRQEMREIPEPLV